MPVPVVLTSNPQGGLVIAHLYSAATTNPTIVKLGAGRLCGWALDNTSAATEYICFHDIATTPIAGQAVWFKFGIPAGAGANTAWETGLQFNYGLAFTTVTGAADSNNTAVAAGDLVINLFYA